MTSQNPTSIILAGILVLSAEGMLDVHTQVLSEPLFLTFLLLSLLFLSVYSETRRRTAFFLASIFAGAALLTRFTGLALVISGTLGFLLLDHRPWKKRLPPAFAFAALASLPCLLFLLRNVFLTGSLANRPVGWTPAGFRLLTRLLPTLSNWIFPGANQVILPDPVRLAIRIVTVLAFVGLATFLFVWRKRERTAGGQKRKPNGTIVHAGLFLISYFGMSFGLIFLDKEMTFNLRILVPAQVVFLVFVVGIVYRADPFFASIRTWGVRLLVATALFHLISAGVWIFVCHDRGRGYRSAVWSAPAVQDIALMVKQTPERVPIFSNSPPRRRGNTGRGR
jgi:hypothetical protein